MVANLEWINTAPDSENNYKMACPFPIEGDSRGATLTAAPDSKNNYAMMCSPEDAGPGSDVPPNVPVAILICRENSHPFQKRTLLLNNAVKVGRSVAKTKADVNNAIFDCKVLSRYHASLWYENGHFYLADTKSSNGTYVNSYRLSENNKDSGPYEVSSGDIVQFGVDVIENTGSVNTVTHGCIVAMLKLYLPNGKEAKATPSPIPLDELHMLHKIIQEATDREYILEEKLNALRQAIDNCRKSAESSWHAQVYEDHLLCRVFFLEKRLAAVSGNSPPTELQQLLEEKHNYEVTAKESLRQAHEEHLKLMNQVCTLQWSLCSSEDECTAFRKTTEKANDEYQKLSSAHATLEQQMKMVQKSLTNVENRLAEEKTRIKELTIDHEKEISQLKADIGKQSIVETGISDLLNSEKNSIIIDNKSSDMIDYKESTLTESIRSLPDYIKAILPDHVLHKVGCKSLRTPSQLNELKLKLYGLKNELEKCQLESESAADKANDNIVSSSQTKDGSSPTKSKPSDENNIDESKHTVENETKNGDIIEEEKGLLERKNMENDNSNSLEKSGKECMNETKLSLVDEIKKLTEQIEEIEVREDSPVEKMIILQDELASAQNTIAELKNEQKKLNFNFMDTYFNCDTLTRNIHQMGLERTELMKEIEQKSELCRTLGLHISQFREREKLDEASKAKYKDVVLDLKNKLARVIESEANSCRETKDLNAKVADLQRQLNSRPQIHEMVSLKEELEGLKSLVSSKEAQIEELNQAMKSLKEEAVKSNESVVISSTIGAANLMWDHDQGRFLTSDGTSISSISVDLKRLSELEEELVITKEKWAHVNEERSLLSTELHNMTEKYNRLASRSIISSLYFIVPVVAILIYALIYNWVS